MPQCFRRGFVFNQQTSHCQGVHVDGRVVLVALSTNARTSDTDERTRHQTRIHGIANDSAILGQLVSVEIDFGKEVMAS